MRESAVPDNVSHNCQFLQLCQGSILSRYCPARTHTTNEKGSAQICSYAVLEPGNDKWKRFRVRSGHHPFRLHHPALKWVPPRSLFHLLYLMKEHICAEPFSFVVCRSGWTVSRQYRVDIFPDSIWNSRTYINHEEHSQEGALHRTWPLGSAVQKDEK